MTREILFKAVSLNREWVEGYYYYDNCVGSHIITTPISVPPCYSEPGGENYNKKKEVHPDTVCEFTGFVTAGKKIKVFDGDKWELHFYSQLANGYCHNSGTIKRLKNGSWICKESPGLNAFLLETIVDTYKGAFEITGNIHDGKLK